MCESHIGVWVMPVGPSKRQLLNASTTDRLVQLVVLPPPCEADLSYFALNFCKLLEHRLTCTVDAWAFRMISIGVPRLGVGEGVGMRPVPLDTHCTGAVLVLGAIFSALSLLPLNPRPTSTPSDSTPPHSHSQSCFPNVHKQSDNRPFYRQLHRNIRCRIK